MTFFILLASIKAILLSAVWGRLDGGGVAKSPEWVERTLIMFYFVAACAVFSDLWALLAYVGVVGIATGHGQYFLDRSAKDQTETKEKVDIVVRLLFGTDPRDNKQYKKLSGAAKTARIKKAMNNYGLKKLYWRNVFGMFCTGFLVGLPAALIALYFSWYIPALLFLLTGPAKALAYIIGYRFWKRTEPAEWINGGLRGCICVGALLYIVFVGT